MNFLSGLAGNDRTTSKQLGCGIAGMGVCLVGGAMLLGTSLFALVAFVDHRSGEIDSQNKPNATMEETPWVERVDDPSTKKASAPPKSQSESSTMSVPR